MNHHHAIPVLLVAAALASCSPKPDTTKVTWETLGNITDDSGSYFVQRLTVTGNLDFDRLAFNQFPRQMSALNEADTLVEIMPNYYCIASPRFREAANDTVVIDIRVERPIQSICYAPDGFHTVVNATGATAPAEFAYASMTAFPAQYATDKTNRMPDPAAIYDFNQSLVTEVPGDFEVIPSFKSVTLLDGESTVADIQIVEKPLDPSQGEKYLITIQDNVATVAAAPATMPAARSRAAALIAGFASPTVSNAVIEDEPDFKYRAVMIDISRNYQTPAEMRRVLDLLSRYGFNHLHFHFNDDDAWRLDIPGLPELVEVGARRGYTLDDHDFLAQIHTGDGDPNSTAGTANGYFTRDEFISMLRYADSLGIKVLPEVESPGHARAAIKAMEKRYRTTGDASMRLIEDGDSSVYTSAQGFHDNVANPALESTYNFFTTVYDEIAAMYNDAGVTLPAIHIGGDEVPRGAWGGAPSVNAYKEQYGIANDHDMHAVFNRRVSDYLASKGIKVSGWQEVVCGRTDDYNAAVAPNAYSVNSWTKSLNTPDAPSRQALDGGYPLILSNVNRFYLDMCPTYHPDERGLTWSTPVDEFISLGGYPEQLIDLKPGDRENIFGLSGQLFSETVRSGADMEMRLLPVMLGLAERAWNSTPTYTDAGFNAVIAAREIPAWESDGYNYHLRMPGIKLIDGSVNMNSPYNGLGEIRFTTDGSDPSAASELYTAPFTLPEGTAQIRAAYFLNGKHSIPAILYIQ